MKLMSINPTVKPLKIENYEWLQKMQQNVDRYDDIYQFEIIQIFLQESDQRRMRIQLVSHMMLFFEVLCART